VIVVLMVVFVVIDVVRAGGRAGAFVDGGGARGSLEGRRFRRRLG